MGFEASFVAPYESPKSRWIASFAIFANFCSFCKLLQFLQALGARRAVTKISPFNWVFIEFYHFLSTFITAADRHGDDVQKETPPEERLFYSWLFWISSC
jgi:hypothetical protein